MSIIKPCYQGRNQLRKSCQESDLPPSASISLAHPWINHRFLPLALCEALACGRSRTVFENPSSGKTVSPRSILVLCQVGEKHFRRCDCSMTLPDAVTSEVVEGVSTPPPRPLRVSQFHRSTTPPYRALAHGHGRLLEAHDCR